MLGLIDGISHASGPKSRHDVPDAQYIVTTALILFAIVVVVAVIGAA